MSTINKLLGLKSVSPYSYGQTDKTITPKCPSLLYGVELEIEGCAKYNEDWLVPGLKAEHDGSLRNGGVEFITKPMYLGDLMECINTFFKKHKFTEDNYSERCSIHVHTNCQDLTQPELHTILLVYNVFERLLFAWVGGDRDKNIFCVPWHQTAINTGYLNKVEDLVKFKYWQKYTALNVLPLLTQGTIEWRHMPGHCDAKRIQDWCQIIGCIYRYAKAVKFESAKAAITSLNTNSQYDAFMHAVFDEYAYLFFNIPNYAAVLEEGVLAAKFTLYNKDEKPKAASRVLGWEDVPLVGNDELAEAAQWLQNMRVVRDNPAQGQAIPPLNANIAFREAEQRLRNARAQLNRRPVRLDPAPVQRNPEEDF